MRVEPHLVEGRPRPASPDGPSARTGHAPSTHSRSPLVAVAATVVLAFALHGLLASSIDGPRAFVDELLYFDASATLAEGEGLAFRGDTYRYAPLYPMLLAPLQWIAADREAAYGLAKALNALLFSLTAIPIFLLARRVLPPWPSVAAAALSVVIPSATYVSVVMTESFAYLVCCWVLYAIVLALERPSVLRQLAALSAILVATGVRTQFFVLYGTYVLGLVLVSLLIRERRAPLGAALVRLWPTVLSAGLGGAVFLLSSRGSSRGPLGDYAVLWRSYDPVEVARWLLYHLANLELYLAVVPFAVAPIGLVLLYSLARAGSERHAAFLALFVAGNGLLLVQVATFNTTEFAQGLFHDRPLFYVVPLWLVTFLFWLVEGAPRPLVASAVGAALALLLPFLLPYSDYVRDDLGQEFETVSTVLWVTVDSLEGVPGRGALVGFAALLVLAALLVPLRAARLALPAAVVFVFALTTQLGWSSAASWSDIRGRAVRPPDRLWLDDRVPSDRSVTLLTTLSPCARFAHDAFYLSEFFNSSVERVAHLGQAPDGFPSEVGLAGRQVVHASGKPLVADFVVAQRGVAVEGRPVVEGTRAGLVLWEIGGPVRLGARRSALELQRLACRAAPQ